MPPFSWSKSRDGTFRRCLREYYYQYYVSRDRAATAADPAAREILIMSTLRTRPMWVGSAVHEQAHLIVTGARMANPPSSEQVLRRLRRRMEADWQASLAGRYREDPKGTPGLVEHYYGEPVGPADLESDLALASRCIQNVYQTEPYRLLAGDPSVRILEAESLGRLNLSGLTVWVVLDLALRLSDGRLVIVDWKTGRDIGGPTVRLQLAVYALYAASKFAVSAGAISTWEMSLSDACLIEHRADAGSLAWAEETILTSARQMRSLLVDAAANRARELDFPMTEDCSLCACCSFRRACGRGAQPPNQS